MKASAELSFKSFRSPAYWPMWAVWLTLRILALLPYTLQREIGRLLGAIAQSVMRKQARYAARNLEICFPELDAEERARLLARHFDAIGMSFVEMGIGWFTPIERLRRIVKIDGVEHLEKAISSGRGVLLFCGHFTTVEVGVALLEDLCERCACMYRPQRNAMMDVMIRRGRSRFAELQIPRDNVRQLLKALKSGYVVAYMPDQTYIGKQSHVLPFFGEPAVTNTATSKLAKLTGATVLTYFFKRVDDSRGYRIVIGPPLAGLPSDDPLEDTRRLFARLEEQIRSAPEQYLWLYKKFKRRPAELGDAYRDV